MTERSHRVRPDDGPEDVVVESGIRHNDAGRDLTDQAGAEL